MDMTTSPAQRKLADALIVLKKLQTEGKVVIKSKEMSRLQRESLVNSSSVRLSICISVKI